MSPQGGAGECWKCKLVKDWRTWAVLAALVLAAWYLVKQRRRR